MIERPEGRWVLLPLLLATVIVAIAAMTAGEAQTWDDEADFEGGDWDAVLWDGEADGITLTGKSSFWKYRANSVITEGSSGAWDDEGIFEPTVVFAKGQYHVYYTGYDGSDYAIGLARSSDGKVFTKYGSAAVIAKGGAGLYDGTGCREPTVLYEDGLFKMWYTGINGAVESIAYATSKDGLSWTKYGTNPVLTQPSSGWGSNEFGDPCVIRVDGKYFMYLSGSASLNNKLVGMATSTDGTSWTLHGSNPIVSKAGTGQFGRQEICDVAVVKDGPLFRMYFSGRNTAGEKFKIGYGESFDGYAWDLSTSIYINLGASGAFDDTELGSPCVIRGDGGAIHMYYQGNDATDTEVGLATSMPWPVRPNTPNDRILGTGSTYDSTHLFDPCVFKTTSGTYAMYYGSYQGSNTSYYVAYASSSSPSSSWSRSGSNPMIGMGPATSWDDAAVGSPCVIFDQGLYKMWYAGYDGSVWKIGYATSTTGTSWTKYGSNPVVSGSSGKWDATGVTDPWVMKVGNTFHMWYVGWTGASGYFIGHATSTDGTSWTKDSANPVLAPNPEHKWEQYYVMNPCVTWENGRYVMYYSGTYSVVSGFATKQRVGLAYSPDGVNWEKDPMNPIMDWGNSSAFDDDGVSIGSVLIEGGFHHIYTQGYSGSNWEVGYATFATKKGFYTTPVLDASSVWPVAWGTLSWEAEVPLGTSVKFQVATNQGGSVWRFVGPDGTDGTYFTQPGQGVFWYQSGKYMRVRAYITTDDLMDFVPVLRSITVTYGPRAGVSPPTVTVTSPNGGEDWMKTKAYPITWDSHGNLNDTSVSIAYSTNNGTSWTDIVTRKPNTGFYKWTVPSTETSGALIRVTVIDIDGLMTIDISDATFAIDPPAPKAGTFHHPSEGGKISPGPISLSWTVEDPWGLAEAPLTLELTTDGGRTWTTLTEGMPFSDGIQWDVPQLTASSDRCQLRLSVLSWLGDVSVIESGEFSIDVNAPTVTLHMPDEKLVEGEPFVFTATVEEDLGPLSVVLHVGDEGDERQLTMEPEGEGVWSVMYTPGPEDERAWVTVDDGVHQAESSVHAMEVTKSSASGGAGTSSLMVEMLAATGVAIILTVVIVTLVARRKG